MKNPVGCSLLSSILLAGKCIFSISRKINFSHFFWNLIFERSWIPRIKFNLLTLDGIFEWLGLGMIIFWCWKEINVKRYKAVDEVNISVSWLSVRNILRDIRNYIFLFYDKFLFYLFISSLLCYIVIYMQFNIKDIAYWRSSKEACICARSNIDLTPCMNVLNTNIYDDIKRNKETIEF